MLDDFFTILENLLPWNRELQKAEELALQAEARVRQLNGLSAGDREVRDLVVILQSTCLLLERLVERPELIAPPKPTFQDQVQPTPTPVASQPKVEPPPITKVEPEPEVSATAKELIKLRDWVLLAKSGEKASSPEVLSAIYTKLGQILEQEGVTAIEDAGPFNYERQQVVSTQATDDPEKVDCICDTVRPGYQFHGKLIRPQEAIVYTYEQSTAITE